MPGRAQRDYIDVEVLSFQFHYVSLITYGCAEIDSVRGMSDFPVSAQIKRHANGARKNSLDMHMVGVNFHCPIEVFAMTPN